MKNKRVCFTTFIYGEIYQEYIPLFLYSCHKSYPEYDVHLFLYEGLREDIKKLINLLDINNVYFHEHSFCECKKMKPYIAQTLRWVIWDPIFMKYDYLYIADIDMFYIREPIPLHIQHVEHMILTGLPFDNLIRKVRRYPWKYDTLGSRIKRAGFNSILNFLFGSKTDYKLTGLHFIDVKPYYKKFDTATINKYKRMIIDNSFVNKVMSANDESFLYFMINDVGFDLSRLGIMTDNIKMLDFNARHEIEFRPHHGIHMGIFRVNKEPGSDEILNSDVYKYYIQEFISSIMNDSTFKQLLESAPERIKLTFERMFYYYKISF